MRKKKLYNLGCKALMFNGILYILIGVYAVLFNNTPLFSIIDNLMYPNFWDNEPLSQGTLNFTIFTWDFLGMFHIIWGINIWYVTKHGLLKRKESWAWKSLFFSLITWLLVDVYFTFTVKQNTFLLVTIFLAILFIVPLVLTKNVLFIKESNENK